MPSKTLYYNEEGESQWFESNRVPAGWSIEPPVPVFDPDPEFEMPEIKTGPLKFVPEPELEPEWEGDVEPEPVLEVPDIKPADLPKPMNIKKSKKKKKR